MQRTDIDTVRTRLVERRRDVIERMRSAAGTLDALDRSQPIEAEEEAQELNIARPQAVLGDRNRRELAAIDAAIARMERGNYGVCETCDEPISLARLLAVPATTQCVDCAELAERRRREVREEPYGDADEG